MNLAGSEPALIGVDWGTTSLRAFLIDTNGQVMDGVSSPEGIMHASGKTFEAILDRLIGPWRKQSKVPVIASGMITSRNGWVETPYAALPLGARDLARGLPVATRQMIWLPRVIFGLHMLRGYWND